MFKKPHNLFSHWYRSAFLSALILVPYLAHAVLQNPLKADTIEQLLLDILALVIRIGSIVLVVFVIYSGAMFIFARGKPEELKKARQALLWTLIGGVILLGAQIIAQGVKETVEDLGRNASVTFEIYG